MNKKQSKFSVFFEILNRSVVYNFVELVVMFLIIVQQITRGEIWQPLLWFGFCAAAAWVFITLVMSDAEEEIISAVKDREVFMTDFMSGALIFFVLAFLVRGEFYPFWIMYLVAAGQHMRYTVLSYKYLVKEKHEKQANKTAQ